MGVGVDLAPDDVAARGNFCTVDSQGLLVDRRAGRIPTAESTPLLEALDQIEVPGLSVSVYPVRDYRFVLVLRARGWGPTWARPIPRSWGRRHWKPRPCPKARKRRPMP